MRKIGTILVGIIMVATAVAFVPSVSAANTVASSTMIFEGTLTANVDGTYDGVVYMVNEDVENLGDQEAGYDIYAKEGDAARFSGDPDVDPIVGHDGWPDWDPDTPDWYQYSLELSANAWALRNHAGSTESDPHSTEARGVPMSGCMDWDNMYAIETDVGEYISGTGTPANPGWAAANGGGAQAWDMDWSWGSEVVPLQYPGFEVQIIDLGSDNYRVILTPGYGIGEPTVPEQPNALINMVTIAGGSTGQGGWENPIIKAKWEVTSTGNQHDDDMQTIGTQVAPFIGGKATVYYYAVILQRSAAIHSAYAYVYHPDCSYKYKVPLTPLGTTPGQNAWNNVKTNNPSVITYNSGYTEGEIDIELADYLNCVVYRGSAYIDYCQAAGFYKVGVRAFDGMAWSETLWNQFWYIPTAAIALDFSVVNYGNAVTVGTNTWRDGNLVWGDSIPTVRNYGNVPVELKVLHDDMFFAKDSSDTWNVEFDARLGPSGGTVVSNILPFCEHLDWDSAVKTSDDATSIGVLDLCTEEKLDFSIHIKEANPGTLYEGNMILYALISGEPVWDTPLVNEITDEELHQTMPPGAPYPPCCGSPE